MSWPRDPDDGPLDPLDSRSSSPWPESDPWARSERQDFDDAPREAQQYDAQPYSETEPERFGEPAADERDERDARDARDARDDRDERDEPDDALEPDDVGASVDEASAGDLPAPATTPLEQWDEQGGAAPWDPRRNGERRRATTAEEAVPWLIGIILALSGMVIVLLALIFTSNNGALAGTKESPLPVIGLGSGKPSASGSLPAGAVSPGASATASTQASATATPSIAPSAEASPAFGAIEMVYLGKKTSSSPVYLWRRDFSKEGEPTEQASAQQGIASVAWAPDGSVGAVVVDGHVVAIDADGKKRPLFDGAGAITFGGDASTVYVVQIGRLSGKDRAQVFAVDFAKGTSKRLTDFTYAHPQIIKDAPLTEAAFNDEGGVVRLWSTADGNLVLWILGAPGTYRIDPVSGVRDDVTRTPTLVSPDGARRVDSKLVRSTTTLTLYDRSDQAQASVKVTGLVSHLRWAPNGSEVSFTLGVLGRNGGVVQNLYLWDLVDGKAPMALTSDGTSFGAEWLGASQSWQP